MQERITNPVNKKQTPHITLFTLVFGVCVCVVNANEKRDKQLCLIAFSSFRNTFDMFCSSCWNVINSEGPPYFVFTDIPPRSCIKACF